jgi:hypothetical protein
MEINFDRKKLMDDEILYIYKQSKKWSQIKQIAIKIIGTKFKR